MTHVVAITPKGINPDLIEIWVGDHVCWRNDDSVTHRLIEAFPGDPPVDTGDLEPGHSCVKTFLAPSLSAYKCKYHPSTHGAVIVVEG